MEQCNDPKWASQQLTKEEAIEFGESGVMDTWTDEQIVRFQLFQKRMCMGFSKFHGAIEKVLNRPVFTHEFGSRGELVKEYLGEKPMPTMEEIINLIPEEKRLILSV